MSLIYHITKKQDWISAQQKGAYEAASLAIEGFIHCSEAHQVAGVLERYYAGQKDLLKLVIETEKLQSRLVYEWSPSTADTFPHIYGPIHLDAVIATEVIS
jgi:uncharacterized protein (DUF952 family)